MIDTGIAVQIIDNDVSFCYCSLLRAATVMSVTSMVTTGNDATVFSHKHSSGKRGPKI